MKYLVRGVLAVLLVATVILAVGFLQSSTGLMNQLNNSSVLRRSFTQSLYVGASGTGTFENQVFIDTVVVPGMLTTSIAWVMPLPTNNATKIAAGILLQPVPGTDTLFVLRSDTTGATVRTMSYRYGVMRW